MRILTAAALLLLSSSVSAQTDDSFYFPVGKLADGKTYVYVNKNDTTEKAIWELRSIINARDTSLETKIYNKDRRLNELMIEKNHHGNATIQHYTLYRYDGAKAFSMKCVVEDSLIFKKLQRKEEKILWRIYLLDPVTEKFVYLQKARTLISETGSERLYSDRMTYFDINGNTLHTYTFESRYRKGIGLISYKINVKDGRVRDFQLVE